MFVIKAMEGEFDIINAIELINPNNFEWHVEEETRVRVVSNILLCLSN